MPLVIWRARHSDSSPREQADAVREVVDAVGGRVEALYWTVNAGELLAVVEFDATQADGAVLGARVLVQSGEFAVCDALAVMVLDEAAALYERAESLLEDDEDEDDEEPASLS